MADGIAELHGVPGPRIVALEHPGIIRNFDNGLKSLGGEAQLKHVLEHHVGDSKLSNKQHHLPEPVAGVSLRPNDPFAKKIQSTGVETRNVLVKVTVPRRTGRKRKRGSDEPYAEPERPEVKDDSITAPSLVRRLYDNKGNYGIKPVGMLHETHRFRMLPDFQLRNTELPTMREIRDHAMVPDFNKLRDFRIDLTPGSRGITAYPGPPSFISADTPYKYDYQQAAGVIFVQDEAGNITSKNTSMPRARHTWNLPADIDEIPQHRPMPIPNDPNGELLQRAIRELQKILDKRPLVTKRVAMNAMPPCSETIFKDATQYVGYSFKAGPWRDSLIKYGVDPRKDPKYRFYQTLMFQVDREAFKPENIAAREDGGTPSKKGPQSTLWSRPLRHTKDDPTTHIFDGKNITANGKTWQICDLTDPIVHKVFNTENIRTECDVFQWGWYHNGTMAKGRAIMKDKMKYLFAGKIPPDEVYVPVVDQLPDLITPDNFNTSCYLDRGVHGDTAASLALEVRNIIKVPYGRRGKTLFKKVPGDNDMKIDDEDVDVDLREIDVGDMDDDDDDDDDNDDDDGEGGDQGDFEDMDQRVESEPAEAAAEHGEGEEAG